MAPHRNYRVRVRYDVQFTVRSTSVEEAARAVEDLDIDQGQLMTWTVGDVEELPRNY